MQWGMALALRIDTGVEREQNSVLPSLVGCWDTYNSEMRSISMGKSRIDLFIPAPQSISNYYFLNLSRKHFSYFNATFMQKFIFPQCWGVVNMKQLPDLFYWAMFLKIQEAGHRLQCKCDWNRMLKFLSPQNKKHKYKEHCLFIYIWPWHMHIYQILT